ncbi:MAG: anti-sigma regulatory factor [Myxococcaceae bacterium]|nr:anti-sigma regulatory factor [Myxococcaceae bacterium]
MPDEQHLFVRTDADIVSARQAGRALATQLGFSDSDAVLIATAISEIARNMVEYAKGGEIVLTPERVNGRQGLSILARDEGPGIADVELALKDGYTTGSGLGLGLPGTRRIMDEFQVDSVVGRGTTVLMKKWVS